MSIRIVVAVALADFRERSRRYSFWVFLVLMAYAAYLFLPAADAVYSCLQLDGNRGVYNSVWVGAQVSMMTTVILALVGFYVVRGGIMRDARLHTGEIVAAAPVSNLEYVAGKTLSNFASLTAMTAVLFVMSGVIQIVRAESTSIDLVALAQPFIFVILPLMLLVAALATLFDSVRFLRGGIGNVVFYFLWVIGLATIGINTRQTSATLDAFGVYYLWNQSMTACDNQVPDYEPWQGPHSLGFNIRLHDRPPVKASFVLERLHWSADFFIGRLILIGLALGLVALAAVLFDRFDARISSRGSFFRRRSQKPTESATETPSDRTPTLQRLSPLTFGAARSRWWTVLVGEWRLLMARINRWWYLVAVAAFVAGWIVPLDIAYNFILVGLWFWPLLIWSKMGCRERLYDVETIIFSTPSVLGRQFIAQWLCGFGLAVLIGFFVPIRLAITSDWTALANCLVGAAFIPSMALACGALTGGRKLFEVLYTLLWYIGPLNKVPLMDFTGSAAFGQAGDYLWLWFLMTIALLLVAFVSRALRLRRL